MTDTIDIQEIREAGEDGGDLMGYFCRGHVDRFEFAKAANNYSGAGNAYDARHVNALNVRHLWYRTVQMEGEPKGTMEFKPSSPGPGAWAATVCDDIYLNGIRRARQDIRNYDRGWSQGMCSGVNWALEFVERTNPEMRDAMLAAYRANRDKLETSPQ